MRAPFPWAGPLPYDFTCTACGWEGTQPVLDAHLNPWCPACGKPVEFTEVLRYRRAGRSGD
jgi:hypothetical protein